MTITVLPAFKGYVCFSQLGCFSIIITFLDLKVPFSAYQQQLGIAFVRLISNIATKIAKMTAQSLI